VGIEVAEPLMLLPLVAHHLHALEAGLAMRAWRCSIISSAASHPSSFSSVFTSLVLVTTNPYDSL
jgi:hypothetical protein